MKPTAVIPSDANAMNNHRDFVDVCVDVSKDSLHIFCREVMTPFERKPWEIANRTRELREILAMLAERAEQKGLGEIRVVMEATGIYHKHLSRVARRMGFETCLVNPEHVKKVREVLFGDPGKSDRRDPVAIADVVKRGRIVVDRQLPETYQLLREWGDIYQASEDGVVEAKNEIHRLLTLLFPDFDFKSDFLYGNSGRAVQRCYGLNPWKIAGLAPSRVYDRLRNHSRIMRSSVKRLLESARASVEVIAEGRLAETLELRLAQAFEDLDQHSARRDEAQVQLESLYDEARRDDPNLPEPTKGVISKKALARLLGQTGPLSDFQSWRQILRYGGLNLCERQSGKYVGQIKISRKGRAGLRHVLNQIALPLVRRNELFGAYYHRKKDVEKMRGSKAMTAVSRKLVKLLFGWYKSGQAFDRERAFRCESEMLKAA